MSGFSSLVDLPAVPRVLRILLQGSPATGEDSLVQGFHDRTSAQKAIDSLLGQGIIKRENGRLAIAEGEINSRTVSRIMQFYAAVDRTAKRRLLFRGILNAARHASLVHFKTFIALMEAEGFSADETDAALDEDSREGYVERLTIMYRAREGLEHRRLSFIPLYYYPHFLMMKPESAGRLRERLKKTGVAMIEEEYLLGRYPKEIASQSREYVAMEKRHIKEKIGNEACDAWWYYRF